MGKLLIYWIGCTCSSIFDTSDKTIIDNAKTHLKGNRVLYVQKLDTQWICIFRILESSTEGWKASLTKISTNIKNITSIVLDEQFGTCECMIHEIVLDSITYLKEVCFNPEIIILEKKKIPENYGEISFFNYTYTHIPSGWEKFFEENRMVIEDISEDIGKCSAVMYPPLKLVYNAFNLCKPKDIKVILIGLDPYPHNPREAMGIAFSVPAGIKIPSSLRNIFGALKREGYKISDSTCGDLTKWVKRGVFLINTALTVEMKKPGSHSKIWKSFTTRLIMWLNENTEGIVWALWGNAAQSYQKFITTSKHKIVVNVHPSGFNTSKWNQSTPFSNIDNAIKCLGKPPIKWNL